MVLNVFYFMPVLMCLIWALTFLLAKKTIRQSVMMVCLAIACIYFVSYGLYTMPNTDYLRLVQSESVSLPLAFFLAAALSIYANLLARDVEVSPWHMLLLIPGLIVGSSLLTLYGIIGYHSAAEFQQQYDILGHIPTGYKGNRLFLVYTIVEQYLLLFFSLFFIILIVSQCLGVIIKNKYRWGDFTRWIFKKKSIPTTSISALCLMMLMLLMIPVSLKNEFVMTHRSLGIALASALSIMIHFLAFTEYHNEAKSSITERLRKIEIYDRMVEQGLIDDNGNHLGSPEYLGAQEDNAAIGTQDARGVSTSSGNATLRERRAQSTLISFRHLMEDEMLYLNTDINVGVVADRLGLGRTTLSTVLNEEYGKNFRSIVNEYRIRYAKAYILEHKSATQVEVAAACGFKDVTSYAHKFKEITGKSPLVWLLETKE